MISAKDLEERNKAKRSVRKELYTRILTQICRKIDMNHALGNSQCVVQIPEYMFGFPTFDMSQITLYMHRQLVNLGYRTSIMNPGIMYVAWGKKKKKAPTTASTAKEDDDDQLPSLANLKKAADTLRKKYEVTTK